MSSDLSEFLRTGAGEAERRERIAVAMLQGLLVEERYVVGMDKPSRETQLVRRALAYTDALIRELDCKK